MWYCIPKLLQSNHRYFKSKSEHLPSPVMDGLASSRLFVCEDVYLMSGSDNISLITPLMHRIRCHKKDYETENQCLNGSPLKQTPEGPSLPPSCSPFSGTHKNHIPFKRYMSLTGRMNGTAWVNMFEARLGVFE